MQKVVFLVDMNAFFISCEMTRNLSLIGKPSAVAGNPQKRTGIILAANYDARGFGVKTAMVLHEALKLCPNLLLVPPDHHFYEQKSKEVMDLLSRFSPLVEQNSIDEAWLDMTGTRGLFGTPTEAARLIMNAIKDELGLWCSIGISENKFLSKMASDMKKPLGITELWKSDIESKLWPMPLQSMYGIGKQTAIKLNKIWIKTIGELANINKDVLIKKLGKSGLQLHQYANGIDASPVTPRSNNDMKSIGRSITLPEDIKDFEHAKTVLLELAEEVGVTARKHDKKGRTVQLTLKYSDFSVITRQKTIPPTHLTKEISSAGIELLRQHWNLLIPLRLIGISICGFDDDSVSNQISMFELPNVNKYNNKEEKIEKAMDIIRDKHGYSKISRAALIHRHTP